MAIKPNLPYTTTDINEATYYILNGGNFVSAKKKTMFIRKYRVEKMIKRRFEQWKIYIENTPELIMREWWSNKAMWNIRDFMEARDLLKKRIVLYLFDKENEKNEASERPIEI